ncbi:MAG: hypothetical protein WC197_09500 [Candidatus Gastranaerophilaceae bacterium]|jgi:hypothetical protein
MLDEPGTIKGGTVVKKNDSETEVILHKKHPVHGFLMPVKLKFARTKFRKGSGAMGEYQYPLRDMKENLIYAFPGGESFIDIQST